jgi:hypothetical protein
MKLTKTFRVLHSEKELLYPIGESVIGSVTYPAEGLTAVEFDKIEDAEKYVRENALIYTEKEEQQDYHDYTNLPTEE